MSLHSATVIDGRDGNFLPAADLRALYGDPPPNQSLVVYCQTGSRAAVDWLVLSQLGYDDVRLYDGSWAEWSSLPEYPQDR
jgi:thiosulfate/3-mercaptopyruvate sulfurtransferase